MKNRLAMFCVLGLGTAVVSGISIAVILSQSKQPKNELDAAKRHILNGVNLNEFTFTTGNLDPKNVLQVNMLIHLLTLNLLFKHQVEVLIFEQNN
ncbi:hypothetical protein ONA24_03765 [Mycoplasmopsis cynos]|uniref:hypothetical protein n=1 Tax=Mycoplasmopsis cynos TaxID=171284 RepID=UPI0024C99914|nr:hypothetical protein [Mycoplasmopsis cynos]MCU9936680.1 hypothetical protein [Mycoplasmopsis cynos]WAM06106.1 hypothetical protein ONA23_03615 [Mycoplasmopsis cynos]WAM09211.1 hypothetical protein ONA24_03765 [Mycoplasmopsis cynos]